MKKYNEELDKLFEIWDEESEKNGLSGFCSDGLMYKGKIHTTLADNGKTYWGRDPGNEDELWHNAKKRILFLMKDPNGNPNEDMRMWIGRQHPTLITNMFFKSISLWLLGLNSIQVDINYLPIKEAIIPEVYSKAFDDLPLAIVNIKKESGKGSVSNSALWDYVDTSKKYGSFLKRQFEILNPNIVVCGGGNGTVFKIAKQIIYPDIEFSEINDWIEYNKENDIVLIDQFHPTRNSYEVTYVGMMKAYQDHLKKLISI